MFCNPEASSALDQDGSAEFPNPSISDSVQSSHAQTSIPRIGGSSADQLPEEPRHSTCTEPSAHCHRPHSDCHLLVYLDAGFSSVCVLVLFSTALPRLRRYGLLVLQATPLHLSVAQVRLRLAGVPGVLSLHELHVWQLSEALLVASLHVHCPAGMNAVQCADLMGRITAVLNAFGIKHCTVQPEFIQSEAEAHGGSACSLRCGQECVEKLCCSPRVEETSCPKTESPDCVQEKESCSPAPLRDDQIRDVVIENTYL